MAKSQRWVVVVNNWTPEEFEALKVVPSCTFAILGKEVGAQGTPHIQGYMEFDTRKELLWMKNHVCARGHFIPAAGTAQHNIVYSTKEDVNAWRIGVPNPALGQGKRTDLEAACRTASETMSMRRIAEDHPMTFVKYYKGLGEYINIKTKDRTDKPYAVYIWGDSGVGKTRSVLTKHGAEGVYIKTDDGKTWYNNYHPHEHKVLLLDEFVGKMHAEDLNRIIDYAPLQLEVKGGYVKVLFSTVYICSNYSFEEASNMGQWTEMQKKCVKRRIDKFIHVARLPNAPWVSCLEDAPEAAAAAQPPLDGDGVPNEPSDVGSVIDLSDIESENDEE